MSQQIDILSSHQIDPKKWNSCIESSENGLIYSRYEYLQSICDNWHGVIVDDHAAVMALPWKKKFGIRYTYEPAFVQQLGLIGSNVELDLKKIVLSFVKYGDALLNFQNTISGNTGTERRTNLVLDLSQDYSSIVSKYKKDLSLNLRRAGKHNLSVIKDLAITEAIEKYQEHYHTRFTNITGEDYQKFKTLAQELGENERCFTRKICNEDGELLAIGLFLKDDRRIYNLMNTTTTAGRITEANHYLIDSVIQEFAGKNILFDFEGSDLPGVRSFYEKFGALDQPYLHWHFNELPFPLRLLKR